MAKRKYFNQAETDKIKAARDKMGADKFAQYVNTHEQKDKFLEIVGNTGIGDNNNYYKTGTRTATKDDPIKERGIVDTTSNNNAGSSSTSNNKATSYTSGNNSDGTEAPDTPDYTNNIDQYSNQKANTEYNEEYQALYDKYGQDNVQFDANGNFDLKETKLGEVMTNEEKREVYDQTIQDITRRRREGLLSFDEANAEMKKAREDAKSGAIYGGATMSKMYSDRIDYEQSQLEKKTQDALDDADDIFAADLKREEERIRAAGKRVMDTTQRLNSLRGAGRSSANEAIIMEQQKDVNSLIASAQAKTDIALQIRKAEINGASAEAMESLTNQRSAIESALNEKLFNATERQKALNSEIAANFADGLQNIMDVLESGDVDTSEVDFDATLRRGGDFLIHKDGSLWINPSTGRPEYLKKEFVEEGISWQTGPNGNKIMFKGETPHAVITTDGQYLTGSALDMMNLPTKADESTDPAKPISVGTDEDGNEIIWKQNPETKEWEMINADINFKEDAGSFKVDFSTNKDLINANPNEASFKNNNPTGITWNEGFDNKTGTGGLLAEAGIEFKKGTARPESEGGHYVHFNDAQDGLTAYQIAFTQGGGTDDVYDRLVSWVGTDEGDSYATKILEKAGLEKGAKFSELSSDEMNDLMVTHLSKESPGYLKALEDLASEAPDKTNAEYYSDEAQSYARNIFNGVGDFSMVNVPADIRDEVSMYMDNVKHNYDEDSEKVKALKLEFETMDSIVDWDIDSVKDQEKFWEGDMFKWDTRNEEILEGASGGWKWAIGSPASTMSGNRKELLTKIGLIVDTQTLNNLIGIKQRGGTFGALSEKELAMLQASASLLAGATKSRSGDGHIKQIDMDEQELKILLGDMRNSYKRLIQDLTGEIVYKDEDGLEYGVEDITKEVERQLESGESTEEQVYDWLKENDLTYIID